MPTFFSEFINDIPIITGKDAKHISHSLRMKTGEKLNICDTKGFLYKCKITSVSDEEILLEVLDKSICCTEPSVKLTLYQAMVKGDKSDYIIQKSVELGVYEIVFVRMDRSISKPDKKSTSKKLQRWNKISLSAAKQSGRGCIPQVRYLDSIDKALEESKSIGVSCFFYELGGINIETALNPLIKADTSSGCIFIGPEGGFSLEEAQKMISDNIPAVTLGKRILRTETAPISALSIIMYLTGNMN